MSAAPNTVQDWKSVRLRFNLMYLAFIAVAIVFASLPVTPIDQKGWFLGLALVVLAIGVLYNFRLNAMLKRVGEQAHAIAAPDVVDTQTSVAVLSLRATPDLVAAALAAKNARFLEMEAAGRMPDSQELTAVAIQAALDLAGATQLAPVITDAKRYAAVRTWYLREGKRSEIHPAGHIQVTTPAIFDAGVDGLSVPGALSDAPPSTY